MIEPFCNYPHTLANHLSVGNFQIAPAPSRSSFQFVLLLSKMSISLYNLSAGGDQIPREFDYSTSRIAVMGAPKCGKSSLIVRWVHGFYDPKALDYVEDIYHKHVHYPALVRSSTSKEYKMKELQLKSHSIEGICNASLDGWPMCSDRRSGALDVQVLDGQNLELIDYSELRSLQIKQTDGFILCFDISEPDTLEDIPNYLRHIWHLKDRDVPVVLCATKTDSQTVNINMERVIEICEELDINFENCFFETSALEDFGISEAFFRTLVLIEESKRNLRLSHQNMMSQKHTRAPSTSSTAPGTTYSMSLTATEQNSSLIRHHESPKTNMKKPVDNSPSHSPSPPPSSRSTRAGRTITPRTSNDHLPTRKSNGKLHESCCVIC